MNEDNLVFLMCLPRSGSTLTQKLLNNHSQIYSKSEPWILFNSANYFTDDNIIANYNASIAKIGAENFINNIPCKNPTQFFKKKLKKFHLDCYYKYLKKEKKDFFLDKTTRYIYIYKQINELFPKAKKILLLRNPIAVLASIFSTWDQDNIALLKNNRYDFFIMIEKLIDIQELCDSNYIVVKYEDLLYDPEAEISNICSHIGVQYEKQMLQYVKSNKVIPFTDPNIYKHSKIERNNSYENIKNISSLQEWQYLYDYLEWIGQKRMKRLGYDYDITKKLLHDVKKRLVTKDQNILHLNDVVDVDKDIFSDNCSLSLLLKEGREKSYSFSQEFNVFFNFLMALKNSEKKYLLYGAGTVGQTASGILGKNVVAMVDKKSSLIDLNINRSKVYSPENIKNIEYDQILITVLGRETEVITYLKDELGIPENKIITIRL